MEGQYEHGNIHDPPITAALTMILNVNVFLISVSVASGIVLISTGGLVICRV